MDIGKRLRELREAKGLSQSDVEDRSGLPQAYVSKVENGRSTPTLQMLERWANALDVELHQLFAVGHSQPEAALMACIPDYELLRPVLLELKRRYPVPNNALPARCRFPA